MTASGEEVEFVSEVAVASCGEDIDQDFYCGEGEEDCQRKGGGAVVCCLVVHRVKNQKS